MQILGIFRSTPRSPRPAASRIGRTGAQDADAESTNAAPASGTTASHAGAQNAGVIAKRMRRMIQISETAPDKLSKALTMLRLARTTSHDELRKQHLDSIERILEGLLSSMKEGIGTGMNIDEFQGWVVEHCVEIFATGIVLAALYLSIRYLTGTL